ncbi:TauD/TfdA dioxygenase family protein [Streptomyces sp. NPDC093108]|uniref:TauD/TfdA dioxygenase family protein n=1 Tax=Streptomyces sp. NPDC093108 TaxID=3366030 RepID=UPI0037F97ECC
MNYTDSGLGPTPTLRRVADHIGAEISGVDLSADLSKTTVDFIRDSLLRHKVLFFRGQNLNHVTHAKFASRFGDLFARRLPEGSKGLDVHPEIWTISPESDVQTYGFDLQEHYRSRQRMGIGDWHTDFSTSVNPPAASVLRCETVPEYGGDTQWTNLVAAYEGLPGELQNFVNKLQAEHRFFAAYEMSESDPRDRAILKMVNRNPQVAIHPVVRVHPETGERALFVNPARVGRIIGLSPVESRHLLEMLFKEVTNPEYSVRFHWESGSVAFWDNRSTAHMGIGDYSHTKQPRTLHRVTLHGDRPVGPDGFISQLVSGQALGTPN